MFRPEDFGGDKQAAFRAAASHARELASKHPAYKVRPTKKIEFVRDLVHSLYPGSRFILFDCMFQFYETEGNVAAESKDWADCNISETETEIGERLGMQRADRTCGPMPGRPLVWVNLKTEETVIILSELKTPAQLGMPLYVAHFRLNLDCFIRQHGASREGFFGTRDRASQIRIENSVLSAYPGLATFTDRCQAWLQGLFGRTNPVLRYTSRAEKRILLDRLSKMPPRRPACEGYIRYRPIHGPEETIAEASSS